MSMWSRGPAATSSGEPISFSHFTNANLYRNAVESVSQTFGLVQAGERIIDRGEIVTPETYQILVSLARAYDEKNTYQALYFR